MCGSNEHEVTPYVDASQFVPLDESGLRERVMATLRVDAATATDVIALYRRGRPRTSHLELATIILSDNSVLRTAVSTMAERKAAQRSAPAYLYYFQWPSPVRKGVLGAMHCVELPFVCANHASVPHMVGSGPELGALAHSVSSAWAAFARTGSPSGNGLPAWAPFSADTRQTMVFNIESKAVSDPYGAERKALAAIRTAQAATAPFTPPGCPSIACVSR
jgi:para-nitrobenzyl esterase